MALSAPTKSAYVKALRELLATDTNVACWGMSEIFQKQTDSEQLAETVRVHNGVGFTPVDAKFLCSVNKQYLRKGTVSEKQANWVKKKMPKYAGQLMMIGLAENKIVFAGGMYQKATPAALAQANREQQLKSFKKALV